MDDERGIGGRKPNLITWAHINYKSNLYSIGKICKEDGIIERFIIDTEDYDKIKERSWHVVSTGYIGSSCKVDGVRKVLYMHNLIMNRLTFDGKGATESVDHINGIGTDNRKANLRVCSQSQQNRNTSNRVRTTEKLPASIDPSTIPRNIWYIPASGSHGDRFAVEIKGIPGIGDILWRTTSSKAKTTAEKLELAKTKREELFREYESLYNFERDSEISKKLEEEYEEIMEFVG